MKPLLENLLDQIRSEPVSEGRTQTELRFLTEVERLREKDYNKYVEYCFTYNDVRNAKLQREMT